MKKKFQTFKLFFSLVLLVFFSMSSKAQVPSLSISPAVQCLNNAGATSAVAFVTNTVAGATSYSWTPLTTAFCPITITSSSPTGTMITLNYSCCGVYYLVCSAYNGAAMMASVTIPSTINCSPFVSVSGNTNICMGSSGTLTASGAQSFTWNGGPTGSTSVVSPTSNTYYAVTGSNSSGCTHSDSVFVSVTTPPAPLFIASMLPNGVVSFNNLSTNTLSGVSYTWNFGNSGSSNSFAPSTTYSSNGMYTVSLTANNNAGCPPVTTTHTIQVASVSNTPCAASFTFHAGLGGAMSFSSTSTGTNSTTNFIWSFGNGNSFTGVGSAGAITSQTYAPGTYVITLSITTQPNCSSSTGTVINFATSSNCSLNANFTFAANQNNNVNFLSTSTGTIASSTYSWNYGDNTSGTGQSSSHVYTSSGIFTVSLLVENSTNPYCVDTHTALVSVCNLLADFTHTVGSGGLVNFNSSSSTPYTNNVYEWDFGDGIYSNATHPNHTYNNAGSYIVTLYINRHSACADSISQALNITGISCSANPNFSFSATDSVNHWLAIPSYPWNVTSALWTWGDGTRDTLLYTSHIYSTPGTYSICLSVTVSCGASSKYCFSFTTGNVPGPYFVNTQVPALQTGINKALQTNNKLNIYPNPNSGFFDVYFHEPEAKSLAISIYDLYGKQIYLKEELHVNDTVNRVELEQASNGFYFIKIVADDKTCIRKFLINK